MILAFVVPFDECHGSDLVILISDNCKTQIFFASFHSVFLRALPDFFFGGVCRISEGVQRNRCPAGTICLQIVLVSYNYSVGYSFSRRDRVQFFPTKCRDPLQNVCGVALQKWLILCAGVLTVLCSTSEIREQCRLVHKYLSVLACACAYAGDLSLKHELSDRVFR